MGMVKVIDLIGANRQHLQEVEFLVDTGSFYTMVSPSLAQNLGLSTTVKAMVVLGDSRTMETDLGVAFLRLLDREGGIPVGVMEGPFPLLGASALEVSGFKVNSVEETLEHSRPFGPAVL